MRVTSMRRAGTVRAPLAAAREVNSAKIAAHSC